MSTLLKFSLWFIMLSSLLACQSGPSSRSPYPQWQGQTQWSAFKQCFIRPEGRVIDTWQANVSHSEGQGYGMLLATAVRDQKTFEELWHWTKNHLQVRDDDLMVWRWQNQYPYTPDMNNASDGDLLIAWALIRAAEIWRHKRHDYLKEADKILTALSQGAVKTGENVLLLPAVYGFENDQYYTVNFSYYVYPALFDAMRLQEEGPWEDLIEDGLSLQQQSIDQDGFPKDWDQIDRKIDQLLPKPLQVSQNQSLMFKRFGYESIRMPLYSCWIDECQSGFDTLKQYWQKHRRPPAWIDYQGINKAEYPMASGGLAIRDLLLENEVNKSNQFLKCTDNSDYYNSVLSMLSQVASIESKVFD